MRAPPGRSASSATRRGELPGSRGAFALLLSANPIPMWVYDLETLRFLEVNEAAVHRYGYTREEFLSLTLADVRPPDELERLEASVATRSQDLERSSGWRHLASDGTVFEVEVTSHLLDWEGRDAVLVAIRDLTEERLLQAELARQALHDPLTGLANAALFLDRTSEILARSATGSGQVGALVVNVDAVEVVASAAGGAAADDVVSEAARRLVSLVGSMGTVARLGGGRFAVSVLVEDEHCVLAIASAISDALAEVITVRGWGDVTSTVSVGVALADEPCADAPRLLRDASSAMQRALAQGGGRFVLFDAEMRKVALESFETGQALAQAVRAGQLRLHYQPIASLSCRKVVACEALLRWQRPGRALVPPDRFIPLAERNGLIVEIGAWVIEHALLAAASWPELAGERPRVAVNLSACQLHDERLVEHFETACARSGLAATSVCVELTESALVAGDDVSARRALARLRALGMEIALDDFGTGYSSLSYVKQLPVDAVKIDRSFVTGLGVDRTDRLLVEAIIRVAHSLGHRVVAEGVETELQLDVLRELGCDEVQGYLLARPVGPDELPGALERAVLALATPAMAQ